MATSQRERPTDMRWPEERPAISGGGVFVLNNSRGMRMYIYIFEDATIKKVTTISNDDAINVEDGILDIIDISDNQNPKYLVKAGKWDDLESAD